MDWKGPVFRFRRKIFGISTPKEANANESIGHLNMYVQPIFVSKTGSLTLAGVSDRITFNLAWLNQIIYRSFPLDNDLELSG